MAMTPGFPGAPQFGNPPGQVGDVQQGRLGAMKRALMRRPGAIRPAPAPMPPAGPQMPQLPGGGMPGQQ